MPDLLERCNTITIPAQRIVQTGAGGELSFGGRPASWEEVIAESIARWQVDAASIFDDDIPTPTDDVMRLARWKARSLMETGVDAPSRIVPTVDGGIAFEWESLSRFESLTVHPDLSLEQKCFEFGSLIRRRRSPGPVNAGADDAATW